MYVKSSLTSPVTSSPNDTVLLELPCSVLASPEVCAMADRTKLSNRKLTGNVAAMLKSGKKITIVENSKQYQLRNSSVSDSSVTNKGITSEPVNLNEFVLSEGTARRNRDSIRQQNYENFFANFEAPKHSAIHWDGKLCRNVLGQHKGVEYVGQIF